MSLNVILKSLLCFICILFESSHSLANPLNNLIVSQYIVNNDSLIINSVQLSSAIIINIKPFEWKVIKINNFLANNLIFVGRICEPFEGEAVISISDENEYIVSKVFINKVK